MIKYNKETETERNIQYGDAQAHWNLRAMSTGFEVIANSYFKVFCFVDSKDQSSQLNSLDDRYY